MIDVDEEENSIAHSEFQKSSERINLRDVKLELKKSTTPLNGAARQFIAPSSAKQKIDEVEEDEV